MLGLEDFFQFEQVRVFFSEVDRETVMNFVLCIKSGMFDLGSKAEAGDQFIVVVVKSIKTMRVNILKVLMIMFVEVPPCIHLLLI